MRELERDRPDLAAHGAGGAELPPLAIVGAGRVGGALARAAGRAGLTATLAGRDDALDACRRSEAAILCVPDAQIETACESLTAAVPPLRFVGHTSGATGLEGLAPARAAGADCFALHPLQTVPDAGAELAGAPCAVAGDDGEAVELAMRLAETLGMLPFPLPDERRAAYHAAAAMASNFLVALEESAAGLLGEIGIDDPRELLAPLVLRSAANWAESGSAALTGPIARGDTETVERHLTALREVAPDLVPLYEALAAQTAGLSAANRRRAVA